MTNTYQILHKAYRIIDSTHNLKWLEFDINWFDAYEKEHECFDYYQYYYAEDRLYIIRNKLTHEIWFTKANSPYKAYINHAANMCESHGHEYRGRDYTCEQYLQSIYMNCLNYEDCDHIPHEMNGTALTDFRYPCFDFDEVDFYNAW